MVKIPFFSKKKLMSATGTAEVSQAKKTTATTTPAEPKSLLSRHKEARAYRNALQEGMVNVLDYIAPAAFGVTPNYIQLENLYCKVLFVFSYARYLNTNWLSSVVNSDMQIDISMFIYPLSSAEVMSGLKRKLSQLQATASIQQEKGQVRDPELETAIADIESLRDILSRGEEKLFQFGIYFTIYSADKEELESLTKQIETLLGGLLIYTKQALMQMEQGFLSSLPLGDDQLKVMRNLDTASLSTSFPFVSSTLTSNEGILYGINLHNSSLILFDRFNSLENANSVVFATSGAGKSFAVKLEALRSLMWGTDIIVIDPENEYERLAEAVGGSILKLSLNSPERINPFDIPQNVQGEQGDDILRSAVVGVKSLVGIMVGGLIPEEDALLDRAIYEAYALKDITTDINTHKNEPPLMRDLQNILANMTGAENLVRRLGKFTEGTFAGLFNQPTNIDLNKGFVVFSIRDLEEQLRPIAMFLVLNFIWNKARYETRRRLVIIDEAWVLMKHKDASDFLYGLVKRARKYFLGVTMITQDVEDFIVSTQGRTIVNNSAMKLLLRQASSAVDQLADVFKLTEGEKIILREAKVGQGIFFAGANHVAIEVVASYDEEQLITTNPAELLKIKQVEERRTEEAAQARSQTVQPQITQTTSDATEVIEAPKIKPQPEEQPQQFKAQEETEQAANIEDTTSGGQLPKLAPTQSESPQPNIPTTSPPQQPDDKPKSPPPKQS